MAEEKATDLQQDFEKCANVKFIDERVEYKCAIGFWSVSGAAKELLKVKREALHYFRQYRSDGEYHEIIGGKSPVEVMRARV